MRYQVQFLVVAALTMCGAATASETDSGAAKKSPSTAKNSLDQELLKSLGGSDLGTAGEDIGQSQFTKIVGQMRSVEARLAKSNSDLETREQQKQIAADLATLLEQLRKQCAQCQGGNCDKPGTSSSKAGQPKQPSGNSPATNAANQPARNSTTDVRSNKSDRPDATATHELLKKALDGLSLPEKDRELMLQSSQDEFLPNFAGSIKKYFERIVEEEGEK